MSKNELKQLNKVELTERYQNILIELKNIKKKLLLMKSLESANIGVGLYTVIDSIYNMYRYDMSKENLVLLMLGVVNLAVADFNLTSINNIKDEVESTKKEKEDYEREFKVRNFIRNRYNSYQIWHINICVL